MLLIGLMWNRVAVAVAVDKYYEGGCLYGAKAKSKNLYT